MILLNSDFLSKEFEQILCENAFDLWAQFKSRVNEEIQLNVPSIQNFTPLVSTEAASTSVNCV